MLFHVPHDIPIVARLSSLACRVDGRALLYGFCYLLIAVGIWLRVEHIFTYNPIEHIWSDTQRHWEQGTETLRRDPMSLTDPVMYQIYIGMLGKLTLGEPLLVGLYTVLLACLTPWIWYRFARELLPQRRLLATGLWAALSMLPSWISIYAYFMQETLLLPLLGAALFASWRCRRKQTLASFLCMVLLWILAGLTRGIAIPLAAVVTTWLWLIQPQKIAKAGFSLLLLVLLLGPLAYRSYVTMHMVSPHGIGKLVGLYLRSGKREIHIHYSNGGANWNYWFGSPSTGEKPLAPLSDWTTARSGRVDARIRIEQGAADWKRAFEAYPLTLSRYAWLTGENLIYLFFGSSWPDSNRGRWLENLHHHSRWLWAPLTVVLLLCTAMYWRRLRGQRMLPVLLLVWIVVQGLLPIAVNEGRYRKPAEGLILVQLALLLAVRRRRDDGGCATSALQSAETVPVDVSPVAIATGSGVGKDSVSGVQYRERDDAPA